MVFPLGVLQQQATVYRRNVAPGYHPCAATTNLLHDNYPLFGSSVDVHVVHTGPSSPDDFQVVSGADDVGRDLCCRSDHQAVIVLHRNHRDSL